MFEAWGRFVHRHRLLVLAVSAIVLLGSGWVVRRGGTLTTAAVEGIEAETTRAVVERAFGRALGSTFTVLLRSDRLNVDDPAFREAVDRSLAGLRSDPHVSRVRTTWDEGLAEQSAEGLRARDGHAVAVIVTLKEDYVTASHYFGEVRRRLQPQGLQMTLTGPLVYRDDLDTTLAKDRRRAELMSAPLAVVVLLLAFGTLAASLLPVGVGGLAVIGGLAGVYLLADHMPIAVYAKDIVSLIGMGVAIDYSLFIVKRFREELDADPDVGNALATALGTTGRAVAFSGLAVFIGLTGLQFFPHSYLSSMGIGGSMVVALAVVYALTFLPAVLSLLGHRIDFGRVIRDTDEAREGRFWRWIVGIVMRHPIKVLLPTLAMMLLLGLPFLSLRTATPGEWTLPPEVESRQGWDALAAQFPDQAANRILVVAQFPGAGPLVTPDRVASLYDLSRRLHRLPGVSRVESIVDLDERMTKDDYVSMSVLPLAFIPDGLRQLYAETTAGNIVLLSVVTPHPRASPEARELVRQIRQTRQVGDGRVTVMGFSAFDLDCTDFVVHRAGKAIVFVMSMTMLVLFLLLGSVVLPVKAVIMNLLSISSSFGAMVFLFQQGHLSSVLHFEPGPLDPAMPLLLFCFVFGLSMDYEVLLLTRMQEEYERTGDNFAAVAEGMARSGRLVTSAAAIMVAVFSAFAFAHVIVIKAVGLGMAIAVALDATIVRMIIVPATMRLFGDWNWWAPRPLVRLYKRFGIRMRE